MVNPDVKPGEPVEYKLKSLRYAYVTPGDVLFVPSGHAVLEKTVNQNSIGFRTSSLFVTRRGRNRLKNFDQWFPGKLGLTLNPKL